MSWPHFAMAAVALSLERLCYIAVWRYPDTFRVFCARIVRWVGDPVVVLAWLFAAFKAIQATTFVTWCLVHGGGQLRASDASYWSVAVGLALMLIGQVLNFGVFKQLGVAGVFYGNRFGHAIAWCDRFPFSHLQHPQYVGAVLTIWGFFLATRFPHADWAVLPLLETVYYVLGARLERLDQDAPRTPA